MSKVLKAHQLNVSGYWRPELEPSIHLVEPTDYEPEIDYLQIAQAEAARLLAGARAEANSILGRAESELSRQRDLGYKAGFESGLAEGSRQGEAVWQAKLDELNMQRQALVAKDASLLREAERESEELALAVIERVINYKLRQDDSVFKAALEQVLEVAQGCREALLLVADENFSEIWQQRTEWKQLLPGVKAFSVETDARLAPGDLVLETNQGTIDARVDTIIGQVAAEFSLEGQA